MYHAEANCDCRTVEMDGLILLFHRPSGVTHFLDSPIPEMLDLLTESPCDAATLTARLCERLNLTCDEEARVVVEARLAELAAVGLVHR